LTSGDGEVESKEESKESLSYGRFFPQMDSQPTQRLSVSAAVVVGDVVVGFVVVVVHVFVSGFTL